MQLEATPVLDDHYPTVQEALRSWSRWKEGSLSIGYPRQAAFAKMMKSAGAANVRAVPMCDDFALRVDKAVSDLYLRCVKFPGDLRWQILTDRYVLGWSDSRIARERRGISDRRDVATIAKAAENWVEAKLV